MNSEPRAEADASSRSRRVEVLRLGHRPQRDKRITTHVALTARALGAAKVHLAEDDPHVATSVMDVATRFGGAFTMESGTGWKGVIRDWKARGGVVVHLTMYGHDFSESVAEVTADGRDVLVVVGAEKVPGDLYRMADWNVAVGNQPHSEVAALALMLDRLGGGAWEAATFEDAEVRVLPSRQGKRMAAAEDVGPSG